MLIIRQAQEKLLSNAALGSWVTRMVRSIASDYPRQFEQMGSSEASDFVLRAIEKGRSNHVETQGGVAVLIELMVQFGEDFQHSRHKVWADEILAHATLPAALKVTLMHKRMTELSQGRVIVPFKDSEQPALQ
jgi:hypothetical protein